MKRVIIVHGWDGSPKNDFYPWLKQELTKKGFKVIIPQMPMPAKLDTWLSTLEKTVGTPDKDTFFVGHSLGCIMIVRYLEKTQAEIGGAVFVAGFSDSIGILELDDFVAKPINWRNVHGKFVCIYSDNDPVVERAQSEKLAEHLEAKTVLDKGKGHFDESSRVKELPSALKAVLDLTNR